MPPSRPGRPRTLRTRSAALVASHAPWSAYPRDHSRWPSRRACDDGRTCPGQRALDVAVAAAREAGRILLADFHRRDGPRGAGDKADADLEAEGAIRGRLLASFPSWGYLGEETGRVTGAPGEPIWLVDPNDGTRDYLVGRRGSAVAIGLFAGGRPVLGVVFAFALSRQRGRPVRLGGGLRPADPERDRPRSRAARPRSVRSTSCSCRARATGTPKATFAARSRRAFAPWPASRTAWRVAAAGEAAAATSLHSPGAWDYAAGHALVRAAGGVLLDERGREIAYAADGESHTRFAFAAAPRGGRGAGRAALARGPRRPARRLPGPPRTRARGGRRRACCRARRAACWARSPATAWAASSSSHPPTEIARRYPDGPRLLADGGRWQTLAGQPTDDSEMALALARTLVAAGDWDAERVLEAYREWYRSGPFDVGQTTRAALNGYFVAQSQANGSLMRASPLGVFAHARTPAEAAALARRESGAHAPAPRLRRRRGRVRGGGLARDPGRRRRRGRLRGGAGLGARRARAAAGRRRRSRRPARQRRSATARSRASCSSRCRTRSTSCCTRPPWRRASWPPSAAEATRTPTRAIAGALLGAVHGRAAVPQQWRSMVLSCRAHPSRARHPRPPACWPTDVLEIAERLLLAGLR